MIVRTLALVLFLIGALFTAPASGQPGDDLAALNRQVVQLYRAGKYTEATKAAQHALALSERKFGPEHWLVADSLNNLAMLYEAKGRHNGAEALHRRALAIREKVLGPKHRSVAQSLNNLALLYDTQGRYAEAEPLYGRALAIREKVLGSDHSLVAHTLNNLAELYVAQGRYAKAEPLHRRSIAIRDKVFGPQHQSLATALNNLAELYRYQGRFDEAGPLYRRALAILDATVGPAHPRMASTLNNLALLYVLQGRHSEAEPLHRRALALWERALGSSHPHVATSLNNLAGRLVRQGRYGEAERLYRRARAIFEGVLGPGHPHLATTLSRLAVLHVAQGRYGEAEPLIRNALAIREKALAPDHANVAESLNNLASLYRAQGRYGEAEPLHRRALAIWEKALGLEHPDVATCLNNLAELFFLQSDWSRAVDYWRRSTTVLMRRARSGTLQLGKTPTGKKQSEAVLGGRRFQGLVKAAYRLALEETIGESLLGEEMFRIAQWSQGSEAAAALAKTAARGAKGDPQLKKLARERQDLIAEWQARDQLRTKQLSAKPDKRNAQAEKENLARLEAIEARIDDADRQLESEFPDYAALANPEPLAVHEVQAQLRPDEALVLFVDTPERKPTREETFVWVVTKTDISWLRSKLGTKTLREKVAALRAGLDPTKGGTRGARALTGKAGAFDLTLAHELYRELLAPAEDLIKDKTHLIVVPSGPLTGLPFQVLVTKEPASGAARDYAKASWMIRRHAITTLPSVASLKALRREQNETPIPRPYLAFADPIFDPVAANDNVKTTRVASRGVSAYFRGASADGKALAYLPRLSDTEEEVQAIARAFGKGAELRIGVRATEGEVKRLPLDRYRIVHFATHGLIAGEVKGLAEAALALTVPKEPSKKDDGLLKASEVAALKLNADWVILSACNTAAGDRPGAEALSGLARAFFYAGAKSLLVSHWPVISAAAVRLTTGAFRALNEDPKIGKAEALRRAMLALIDDGGARAAHPSFWAPFVVVGEGGRQ